MQVLLTVLNCHYGKLVHSLQMIQPLLGKAQFCHCPSACLVLADAALLVRDQTYTLWQRQKCLAQTLLEANM